MKNYILDSYAMIAFFENEAGADKTAEILHDIVRKKAKGYMSVINWGELYYNTVREAGISEAKLVLDHFERYPIQLVDADKPLTLEAAKLKAIYPIAYADCFAAALSISYKACLVTGDREFERLTPKIDVLWID